MLKEKIILLTSGTYSWNTCICQRLILYVMNINFEWIHMKYQFVQHVPYKWTILNNYVLQDNIIENVRNEKSTMVGWTEMVFYILGNMFAINVTTEIILQIFSLLSSTPKNHIGQRLIKLYIFLYLFSAIITEATLTKWRSHVRIGNLVSL